MSGVHRSVDALLDHQQGLARRIHTQGDMIDLLRESLAECLAHLPDTEYWHFHQQVYVITDSEMTENFYQLTQKLPDDSLVA